MEDTTLDGADAGVKKKMVIHQAAATEAELAHYKEVMDMLKSRWAGI